MSMSHNLQAANHVLSKRVVVKTKSSYRGKLKNILKYLQSNLNYRRWIRNGEIKVPLSEEVIKSLFGYLSTNTDLPKKKKKKK